MTGSFSVPPHLVVAALFSLVGSSLALAQDRPSLDEPLCPSWIEGILFDSYREAAHRQGRPQKSWPGVTFEEQTFSAQDGTEIYGYRAFADAQEPEPQPAIVIVPGNAMLADQLFSFAAYFALQNFTAYIFDYRGYGGSAGVPRSNALIKDYREIFSLVESNDHMDTYIYAMSFGGIISLVALADAKSPAALVLDGVPSSLPWYAFCPDWLNPVEALAHAPERTLVISGTDDPVVSPGEMARLREKAQASGMEARLVEGFSHPGIDDPETTLQRLSLVSDFFRDAAP
jgi:alpha-beta hydrolase superfamily lysophospholipase